MSIWKGASIIEDIDPDYREYISLFPVEPKEKPKDESESEDTEVSEPSTSEIKETFETRVKKISTLLNILNEGVPLSSRIDPILKPNNFRTTSILTRGEVEMMVTFLTIARQSPEESEPFLNFCEDYCLLKLSESGFGIEKAIELGKALTEVSTIKTSTELSPQTPTDNTKK